MGDEVRPIQPDGKLAIEPEYGEILMNLVLDSEPESIVEIGTGQGFSTAWLLLGANKNNRGTIYTFDSVERPPYVWQMGGIDDFRIRKFKSEFKDSVKVIPKEVDFVFHDAGHWFEHVYDDLTLLIPMIPVGGIITVHDIKHSYDMGEKLKEWMGRLKGWDYEEKLFGCGLGIARRVK